MAFSAVPGVDPLADDDEGELYPSRENCAHLLGLEQLSDGGNLVLQDFLNLTFTNTVSAMFKMFKTSK